MRKLTEDELVMCADLGVTPEEYVKSTEDESMYLEDPVPMTLKTMTWPQSQAFIVKIRRINMPAKQKESDAMSRINEMRVLREKVESLKNEKSALSERLMSDRSNRPRLAQKVTSLEGTLKNASMHDKESWKQLLDDARQSLERIDTSISSNETRLKEIDAERYQAECKIAEHNKGTSIDDFRAHLKAINEAKAEVLRVEDIIAEQQGHLDSVSDDADSKIELLQSQRQQLLADIALGSGAPEDLKRIDQEIDDLLQDKDGVQRKSAEIHRHVHQTIAGLRPRLEAAHIHKANLEGYTKDILLQVLNSEAEQIAVEYHSHARAMIQAFEALIAIERIMKKTFGEETPSIMAPAWWHMKVPSFVADGAEDIELHDPSQGVLYAVQQALNNGDIDARVEQETQRLRRQGLTV